DSKGRMYFLTFGGLSVYDGARFKNYTRKDGLSTDLINDILEITPDSFLIATNASPINALVRGKIVTIKTDHEPGPIVNQFYRHDDNKVFVSSDEGLFELQNNSIRALNVSAMMRDGQVMPYLGTIT